MKLQPLQHIDPPWYEPRTDWGWIIIRWWESDDCLAWYDATHRLKDPPLAYCVVCGRHEGCADWCDLASRDLNQLRLTMEVT